MKKAYWLAPLAALIVFIFIYMRSRVEFEAHIQADKEEKRQLILKKNEEAERQTAAAVLERQRITAEKNAKDEADRLQREAERKYLEEIDYSRDFAKRETSRYTNVVKELDEAFTTEKEAQKEAEDAIKSMRDEKKFIVEYVAKAQTNEKALKDLLVKLDKLEKDRAEAAKLAAKTS